MTGFSPDRERTRHDALVERARRTTLDTPLTVLCPVEPLAAWLEARIARSGGGFVRFVTWDGLLDRVEDTLRLATKPLAPQTLRASLIETALDAQTHASAALGAALRIDPYGVANALLPVVDELRLAGWTSGRDDVIARACPQGGADRVVPLVRRHLEWLRHTIDALEHGLAEAGVTDLPLRIATVLATDPSMRAFGGDELHVEGLDRVTPRERALLERIADGGTRVQIAPWVVGWTRRSPRPADPPGEPGSALEAFARAPDSTHAERDDDSIVELMARDPDEEAEEVARWFGGLTPQDRAEAMVLVPAEPGYPARVARALARHGVVASYATSEPVARSPLWQIVRASVRLAWRGADPVDLVTVLSAPGAGIRGADRDRLCARLRERIAAGWDVVREELTRATDADALAQAAARRTGGVIAPLDAERVQQLADQRARVEELIDAWEAAGPFARRPSTSRLEALREIVETTLARFANPMRFREAFADARVSAAWVASAGAITDAANAVLTRLAASDALVPPADPSWFLAPVERLLGAAPDGLERRRDDAVRILVETPWPLRRPRVLFALGFQRGRYPAPASTALLLGPLEREALARVSDELGEIADEGLRATLAERDARRALALPTQRLVTVWPRRDARGELLEPSLVRRDLLAAFPHDVTAARLRTPVASVRTLRDRVPAASRARVLDAAEALGHHGASRARAAIESVATGSLAVRDLLVARFRPDARFTFGTLALDGLARGPFSPNALETLLKCRYSFFVGSVLALRSLPLARSPSLSPGEQSALAHAALAAMDEAALDPDAALEQAISARVPWADRGDARIELEEVRRTLRGFLRRYASLRRAFAFASAAPASTPAANAPRAVVRLPMATREAGAPRSVDVTTRPMRIERTASDADGSRARATLIDLRLGGLDDVARRRALGLDLTAALGPTLAQQEQGIEVDAIATVSMGRPEVAMIATPEVRASVPQRVERTFVEADGERTPADLRDDALARLANELDSIAREAGAMPPHSIARRAELQSAHARSCEYCAAWLGCRFGGEGSG